MQTISSSELNELIRNKQAIIIDVREPFEHQACNIKDSILIPSSNFNEDQIPQSSNKKIIIYCKSGKRSAMIIQRIKNTNCYSLKGGIDGWLASGFSVEK